MTRAVAARWVAILGTVYVATTAVGALVAPLVRPVSTQAPAVAQASPTVAPAPTSIATAAATPTIPLTPTPTPTPTQTAVPTRSATPHETQAPAPTPSPTVTPSPTPLVTNPPTPSPTSVSPDPLADLPAFVTDLGNALRRGRAAFLLARLHPAVIDRYGEAACRRFTSTALVDGLSLEYIGADGPAAYEWQLDGLSTTIDDGWTVTVNWSQPGTNEQRDLHLAPSDGTWRWFTDCGDPLST